MASWKNLDLEAANPYQKAVVAIYKRHGQRYVSIRDAKGVEVQKVNDVGVGNPHVIFVHGIGSFQGKTLAEALAAAVK